MMRLIMGLRDRFWRAFWLRQQKYLPPAAQFSITDCHFEHEDVVGTWKSPDWYVTRECPTPPADT